MKLIPIILVIVLVQLVAVEKVDSLKILFISPTFGRSHWIVGSATAKALAATGHEITMISLFPLKNPVKNYRDIHMPGLLEKIEETRKNINLFEMRNVPQALKYFILFKMGRDTAEGVLTHPEVQKLLKSNETFDLIITENFSCESLLGFGQYYNAPVIAQSTFGSAKMIDDLVGNPAPPSYVPSAFSSYTDRMSFWQRFDTALNAGIELIFSNLYGLPGQKALYDKYFPDPKPHFYDIRKNVSLVLLNSHFSLANPRPYLPNVIEIGGIQIDRVPPKTLPKHIDDFIKSADHGVIYFSMGSNLKSANFPDEKKQAFLRAFAKLKEKVIWKYEADLPNKPSNVLIDSWLPQADILQHPNVKLFITHGGLLGTTEAVYSGIPVIGIPIFGDQSLNIARAQNSGWGYELSFDNLSENTIYEAIHHVLSTPSYAIKAKEVSARYKDQPMTPQETAVYWVEYVARHGGAPHIKTAAQQLSFIEYHMLDVFGLMIALAIISNVLLVLVCKKIYRKLITKKSIKKSKKQ